MSGPALRGLPAPRPDLGLRDGYHSAQVDVEVRLNTNESPLPPPAGWVSALQAAVGTVDFHRYPDRGARELRAALAELHGVEPGQVFCANGSNEVLQSLMLAYGGPGRRALTFEPTYALHAHIAHLAGTEVRSEPRGDGFALDAAGVTAAVARHEPAVVFLCSPNNPTGGTDAPEVVEAALDGGGLVVVDEAYGQFAGRSALDRVGDGVPLVVTRTFSKTWSMAAVRLGYAIAPAPVVAMLERVALPYHLDAMTQLAGRLALDHVAEMEARVGLIVEQRERVVRGLAELPVVVWPSEANFVLIRPEAVPGAEVWRRLVERSVLVRDTSSWPGLEGCLRVTIGTADDNGRLLDALAEVLG